METKYLLLNRNRICQPIKSTIAQTIDEYSQDNTVDPGLLWEMVKMKVREVSIKYGTTKKRNLRKEQEEIEISITTLEEQLTHSDVNDKQKKQIWCDIEGKKRELERIIEYQTKGAILRSKSQWYNEGEKNTKYFLNTSASWQPDPILIPTNFVSSGEADIAQMYRQPWPQIWTRFTHQNRLQDWYNFRLSMISPTALREQLNCIFADQPTVFKINLSFGFILRNTETAALQYHHPSANNNLVLEQPFLISNQADLDRLYEQVNNIDFLE